MSGRTRRSVLRGGAAAFAAALAGPGGAAAAEHRVTIGGFRFSPTRLAVRPGDTITWINEDIAPHTATAADGSWDTGPIRRGEAKSVVAGAGMTGLYVCRFHPAMKGEVTVG